MKDMKTINGVIVLVQEERFQLEDDAGGHHLFILTHKAAQEWKDLERLERDGVHIQVSYTEAVGLLAAAAHDIQRTRQAAA